MLRSNVPLGSMGFSAAALAFGYGHQWQEMFRILEATLLQIFFGVWYSNCLFFFACISDLREGWNYHIIIFLAEIIYLLSLILNLQDLKAWWKMRVDKVRFFSFQMLTSEVMTFVNHSQVMLLGFKMILMFIILTRRKGRLKDGSSAISDRAFVGWKQSNSL